MSDEEASKVTKLIDCEAAVREVLCMSSDELFHIDTLVHHCGYSFLSSANGGFGCNHPDQPEREGTEGLCLRGTCPVSCAAVDLDGEESEDWRDWYWQERVAATLRALPVRIHRDALSEGEESVCKSCASEPICAYAAGGIMACWTHISVSRLEGYAELERAAKVMLVVTEGGHRVREEHAWALRDLRNALAALERSQP